MSDNDYRAAFEAALVRMRERSREVRLPLPEDTSLVLEFKEAIAAINMAREYKGLVHQTVMT